MLNQFAERLKQNLQQEALLCRHSADNFIIIVATVSHKATLDMANHLLTVLEDPYLMNAEKLRISVKIGISTFPKSGADIDDFIQFAESAISKSRQQQAKINFFDIQQHDALKRYLDIEQRLRSALIMDGFQIYLQPKINLQTGDIVGYEALLRWHDARLGSVSPSEFIPIAERMNIGAEIDRYVLLKVFNKLVEYKDIADIKPVAVNITAKHFSEPNLTDFIVQQAGKLALPLSILELEITEGVLIDMTEKVSTNLEKLKLEGIKLAIDDFGTGYSSLAYLKNLNVDILKIDKYFVDGIHDYQGQKLVEAIINIAKATNLEVVAEGVETEAQATLLKQLGCQYAQGYYFARPMPMDAVLHALPALRD